MQTQRETTEQQAYQKLTALCARSEHCQHEMLEKMRQWGVDEEAQARVMARLVSEKYVDDERYAQAFVRDKALWMKHIDSETSQRALDAIDDQTYVGILRPMLRQKRRSTKASSEYELTMKLIKFAMSRGFTMDIIRQCIDVDDESEFPE